MFLSSWVMEVLQHRSQALDVPLGRFCLHPHFTIQTSGDPYTTPDHAPITAQASLEKGKEPQCKTHTDCKATRLSSRLSSRRPERGNGSRVVESSHGGMDGSGCVCPASGSAPDLLIESGVLWQSAVGTMANTQLLGERCGGWLPTGAVHDSALSPSSSDIPHVHGLQSPTLPLYDFLPQLPEFTMTRRKK